MQRRARGRGECCFRKSPNREVNGYATTTRDHRSSVSRQKAVAIQLKRNADAHLELIRGDALPKLISKPEVALRGGCPTQETIEL